MAPTDSVRVTRSGGTGPSAITEDARIHDIICDLLRNGSIELSIADDGEIAAASPLMPRDRCVFVPSPPRRSLEANLEHVGALRGAGFDPVPHLAARKLESRQQLEHFLGRAVREHAVHRALLVGGDPPQPAGPYRNSAEVLQDGILADAGIREIVIAGYPEGHNRIPGPALLADLDLKVETALKQGMGVTIVTQFCFAPARILEYCAFLAQRVPEVPVYVGMAGPTDARRLLGYARHCGVSTSLLALGAMGVKAAGLMTHTDPLEQLITLARFCASRADGNVVGAHLFSFGGFAATAGWMRDQCHGGRRTASKTPA